jgi:hypothetical protein
MAHEVTVPSITTVALSAACFAVAEATRLAAKCSETVAAAIDGAYMVSLACVVVLVRSETNPVSKFTSGVLYLLRTVVLS